METNFAKPSLQVLYLQQENVKDYVYNNKMYFYFVNLVKNNILQSDQTFTKQYEEEMKRELENINNKYDIQNEEELMKCEIEKAEYYAKICDIFNFDKVTNLIAQKNSSSCIRMDIVLCKIRLAILMHDYKILRRSIEQGQEIITLGCDWDRRNKFKAYEGLFCVLTKEYKRAGELLFECVPVYESKEFISYERLVLYLIFSFLVAAEREDLKKIITSSDILETQVNKIEDLNLDNNKDCQLNAIIKLTEVLYNCDYQNFFTTLLQSCEILKTDYFLYKKIDFLIRECKIRAYSQMLYSYKSLSLKFIAESFMVSEEYVERDLCDFIDDLRINCMIDRVLKFVYVKESDASIEYDIVSKGDVLMQVIKKNIK